MFDVDLNPTNSGALNFAVAGMFDVFVRLPLWFPPIKIENQLGPGCTGRRCFSKRKINIVVNRIERKEMIFTHKENTHTYCKLIKSIV